MLKSRTGLFMLLFYLGGLSLGAQEDSDLEKPGVPFRVEVEAVNVLVAVHDEKTGQFVTSLTVDDFEIYGGWSPSGDHQFFSANRAALDDRPVCGYQFQCENSSWALKRRRLLIFCFGGAAY